MSIRENRIWGVRFHSTFLNCRECVNKASRFFYLHILKRYRHTEVRLYSTRLVDCEKETRKVQNRPF